MKKEIKEELASYFSDIEKYNSEISQIELALNEMGYKQSLGNDIVFWNHILTLIQRVYSQSQNNYKFTQTGEISKCSIEKAELLITKLTCLKEHVVNKFEIYLLAIYFEKEKKGVVKMNRPIVVIGHRMGKGENTARGIEEAGGTAIIIEGMAADMKLGDVMKEKNADFGISFCGSGGAGAITASNKYGYTARHHLRTNEAGVTAINDGIQVLGFGFMDTESLGADLAKAWLKKNE